MNFESQRFVIIRLSSDAPTWLWWKQVPDILDNAYVIVEYANGSRGMLDLCMFAEGSQNEQEVCVVGDAGKVGITSIWFKR